MHQEVSGVPLPTTSTTNGQAPATRRNRPAKQIVRPRSTFDKGKVATTVNAAWAGSRKVMLTFLPGSAANGAKYLQDMMAVGTITLDHPEVIHTAHDDGVWLDSRVTLTMARPIQGTWFAARLDGQLIAIIS